MPKVDGGFSSTFIVTQSLELMIGVVGFGWEIYISFLYCTVLDYLVCGWPMLKYWGILKNLDTVLLIQKDCPEIAGLPLSPLGDANIKFLDQKINTDDFLWVDEDKSTDIPTPGNALASHE